MLHWLRSKNVDADTRAISAALALAPFLWALKLHLAWWMVSARGIHPLADVPAPLVPLLVAQDLAFCTALAFGYGFFFLATAALSTALRRVIRVTLVVFVGSAAALFSVASWKVQQIYGCALEVSHLRAATGGAAVYGDSVLAYLTPGTVCVLLAAVFVA